METGWIKLHRKIMNNPIYKKSTLQHLFTHCLLSANHAPQSVLCVGELIKLKAGEFASTLSEISKATGIPKTTVFKKLKTLSNLFIYLILGDKWKGFQLRWFPSRIFERLCLAIRCF